jgi:pimeloyl-ACP methyl ester carboxylesterase
MWHKAIGNGSEKVIVLHGWFGDHRAYASLFDHLDTASFTYVFADIRGYGNSRDIDGDYTIGETASDTLALADKLGWTEFHVVGHSMTGKAVQKIAIDGGSRIKSVVALTPVPAIDLPLDDDTFNFFASACDNDEAALGIIGESTGKRLSKVWMTNLLKRAGKRLVLKRSGITCAPLSATISPGEQTRPRLQCSFSPANMTEVCEPICCGRSFQHSFLMPSSKSSPMPVITRWTRRLFISPQG